MNPWTRVGVDEPGSRVEGGEPVFCDYGRNPILKLQVYMYFHNQQESFQHIVWLNWNQQ
jgi:hypothetical protein